MNHCELFWPYRNSHPEVFYKNSVLKNLAKLIGLRPEGVLKKRLQDRCSPVNFAKFLRTPFFYRTLPVANSGFILALQKYWIPFGKLF